MPLDELLGVIETLRQRLRDHGPTLRANETRTRVALIDPLLRALGWDVSDPELVTPEYNVNGRWADYALLGPGGAPAATIEAKKLGEPLASHRMQMLNYSNASGVEYAGLTDGDHWELYAVFQRGQLEDRRILDAAIAEMPAHEVALRLLLLWRPNLSSGQPAAANEPIMGWPPPGTRTPARATAPGAPEARDAVAAPQPDAVSSPATPGKWVALAEYESSIGSALPQAIRFPDGDVQEIRHWLDILVAVATWLSATSRLTAVNTPVASSARNYIVHEQPMHPTGNEFFVYQTIADGSFAVNTHASARGIRRNARKLLEHCGVNPETVQLQVEQ